MTKTPHTDELKRLGEIGCSKQPVDMTAVKAYHKANRKAILEELKVLNEMIDAETNAEWDAAWAKLKEENPEKAKR